MKNIVLIGFMGSGKTAVAGKIAAKLKMKIIDTDSMVEKNAGMKIKKIFALYGEKYFRSLETKAVLKASKKSSSVISTGGGIVLKKKNISALKKSGTVFYLKNSFTTACRRLKNKKDRPLFDRKNKPAALKLYRQRLKLYAAAADMTIVTDKKNISRTAAEIIRKVKDA